MHSTAEMDYLLLELLVDGIHSIFDGNALQVPCGYFEP